MDDWSWVGPAIGAIGGYLGNRGGGDQTTTTQQLPPELQPLAGGVAQRGLDIGNLPYTPYPYARTADFNPYQFSGFDQIAARAQAPNALLSNAESNLAGTLGGQYLNGNPYLDQMVNQTSDSVMGRLNSGAFSSGAFGNAGVAQSGAKALADSENQLRYGAYNDERNRQMQGLSMAPNIYSMGYMPGQQMLGIGATMQQQGQNVLDANYQQFQEAQNWPFRTYDAMMAPFGRNLGGSTTQTGPAPNPVAGMLGGAMLGNRMQQSWNQPQQQTNWSGTGWGQPQYGSVDYGQYF